MAEFDFLLFGPCITYSDLLNRNCAASTRYCQALTELVLLAGKQNSSGFAEAKRNCEICLINCKRTTEALRAHKAEHGC